MSRIRKKHLGVIPVVLAVLTLFVGWLLPTTTAQAEGGGYQASASVECVEGRQILTFTFSGYTPVEPNGDANSVKVYVDGGSEPVHDSLFTADADEDPDYTDSVDLGDPLVSHDWRVEVTSWDSAEGDKTLTGTSSPCIGDDDGDGVLNNVDQCPGTPPGDVVDANGCSSNQLDADGDGVSDAEDQCPNQAGPADNGGCPVEEPPADSDGDGVPDNADQCANTPAGESVDANGCSDSQKDSDQDGVNDATDECPNVAGPASNNGCPVEEPPADSDGDGVSDDRDECPDTPPGTTVNGKGCPVGNDNPGNNGTIKVDGGDFDSHPDNEPHVGCTFQVDFYNYGKDVGNATVSFELQAPTVDGRTLTVTSGDLTPDIGEDPPGGGTDLDASETYTLAFTGEPHAQGYHVKLTINAPDSQGNDVKHKVFWVEGCEPDEEEPSGSSDFVVSCESLVINEPKDVMPEDSEYQYFLDGEAIEVGSHELAPGEYTLTLEVDGEQVDSDTFTVEECVDEPPVEEPNTYSVTSTCDFFDPEDPDQLSNGTISATVNNTDDETDAPLTGYTAEVYFDAGAGQMLAFEPKAFGNVADGQSGTVTFEHANGGTTYTVKILDGDDKVVFEKTVDVEFCDTEPPGEGDVDVVPLCGAVKVTNNEDTTAQFFHGSFDNIEPDGIVPVKPGETVKVKTDRKSLDWAMIWDDGKFTQGENLKVDQKCGDQPDNPDNPDNPDQPDNPDNPDQPNWPDTPIYGVPETGSTLTGSGGSGNGWPLMLFGAGGLAVLALTRRIRAIKVTSS